MAAAMTEVQQRNLELIRSHLDTIAREGFEGVMRRFDAVWHPDATWTPAIVGLGRRGYQGEQGMREYWDDVSTTWSQVEVVGEEMDAVGEDTVLVLGRLRVRGGESGVPVEEPYGVVYRIESGRVRSAQGFTSHKEARAAANA
jgi:ketosteroid isomerase-like protein